MHNFGNFGLFLPPLHPSSLPQAAVSMYPWYQAQQLNVRFYARYIEIVHNVKFQYTGIEKMDHSQTLVETEPYDMDIKNM